MAWSWQDEGHDMLVIDVKGIMKSILTLSCRLI